MATVRVWFTSGDTAEWTLKEGMDLRALEQVFRESMGTRHWIRFGAEAESGRSSDYNFVGLSMSEVAAYEFTDMLEVDKDAALWAELETIDPDAPNDHTP
jgi:hypothetical protein